MPVSTFLLVIASCDIGICDNHSLVSVLRRRVSWPKLTPHFNSTWDACNSVHHSWWDLGCRHYHHAGTNPSAAHSLLLHLASVSSVLCGMPGRP